MTCYHGSTKMKNIYFGSTKIKEVYHGSTLVYRSSQYAPGQVIFESATAGTYSLDLLETGKYEVYCVAGGGSGARYFYSTQFLVASGGSGSGFIGNVALTKGTMSIVVGSGGSGQSGDGYGYNGTNSSIGSAVICYAGGGGNAHSPSGRGGSGGSAPSISVTVYSTSLNSAGNGGGFRAGGSMGGGASLYAGYGKGGDASTGSVQQGTSGYVKITYIGN